MQNEQTNVRRRQKNSSPEEYGISRLPPNSTEAEQGVLGCILLDPPNTIGICVEKFVSKEVFYDIRHQTIYETMIELWSDNDPIDLITLYERLKAWNLADQVGGIAYISTLPDQVPSAANLEYYADIVREKYLLRRMITVCTNTVSRLYDAEGDIDTVLDECERDVLRVNESRVVVAQKSAKDLVKEVIIDIENSYSNRNPVTGISTGFRDFDRLTGGLQFGEMVIIAARPSVGKTSLAMNIADYIAVDSNLPVGVFSLEMTAKSLMRRLVCARARVNSRNITDGFLGERDIPRLTNASSRLAAASIYIDDTGGLSVLQVRAKARRWAQQYGIKVVVIDYLQLMNAIGGKRRYGNRQEEVTDISKGIKNLAKELNIPVVVLAQLNREMERDNRRPRLSDLRESGSIEQDADVVSFIYKEETDDNEDDDETIVMPAIWDIQKNRNGPTGPVRLTFLKYFTRFESAARVSSEDVPEETTTSTQGTMSV